MTVVHFVLLSQIGVNRPKKCNWMNETCMMGWEKMYGRRCVEVIDASRNVIGNRAGNKCRHRCENNFKMALKKIGHETVYRIHLLQDKA